MRPFAAGSACALSGGVGDRISEQRDGTEPWDGIDLDGAQTGDEWDGIDCVGTRDVSGRPALGSGPVPVSHGPVQRVRPKSRSGSDLRRTNVRSGHFRLKGSAGGTGFGNRDGIDWGGTQTGREWDEADCVGTRDVSCRAARIRSGPGLPRSDRTCPAEVSIRQRFTADQSPVRTLAIERVRWRDRIRKSGRD